jgi:hypothetical protein
VQCGFQGSIFIYETRLFCFVLSHWDLPNHNTSCHALGIFEISQWIWVHWLGFKWILSVPVGFQDFATHFLDDVLFQDVAHIDDLLLLGDAQVALGILASCVTYLPSYLTQIVPPSFSFMSLLAGFNMRVMQICGDIMGPCSWESFQGPLTRH